MTDNRDIPDEEQTEGEDMSAKDAEHYASLCETLKRFRDEAINGRAESGIEGTWLEDEEFYDGIDDANRAEKAIKPTSPDGRVRLVSEGDNKSSSRSTVFVEITRPYVDAAAARVADMLLPTDDRNWALVNTPIPDLINRMTQKTPVAGPDGQPVMQPEVDEQGNPAMAPQMQDGQPAMGPDGQPVMAPVVRPRTVADEAKEIIAAAKESAEKAQTRIDDWLTECSYIDECRLVIDDAARIGTGILRGPMPRKLRKRAVVQALEGIGIVIKEEIAPVSNRVDCWNFYPDPNCGEDIQRGKYVFEADDLTGRQLGDLKGVPGYLTEIIDEILEEGPKNPLTGTSKRKDSRDKSDAELYQVWYFHGYLSADDLDLLGTHHGSGEQFPVIATMVNDRIIKAALSPLDSGEFPYDVMIWQRRAGHWAGKGVARQMRTEQRGVNAATRALMDNMGFAKGPIWAVDRTKLVPINGKWEMSGGKGFYTRAEAELSNIRDAIMFWIPPSLQGELQAIIEFWTKKAEDATGLPMLLQGQLGRAPDTVGGMTMLNNNASTVLRRIAKTYDARITERHIGRYYEWLLLHGKDDSEKGDFTIKARGSSALFERDAQGQILMQSVGMSLNPRFGLDPKKIMAKFLKSQRLDVTDLEMSQEELEKISQGQPDPRVQAAELNAKVRGQELQAEQQQFAAQLDFDAQQRDMDRALDQWAKKMDADLELLKMNSDQAMGEDELKAMLASNVMKLRAQIGLAMRGRGPGAAPSPQVAMPSSEPPQRAEPGFAFQQ